MKTRLSALKSMIKQYAELKESEPRNWPDKFRPQGAMIECNFGCLLIILSNDGEAAVIWRDWAGDAIDDNFEVCEVCNWYTDDDDDICIGDPYIKFKESFYPLNMFVK